MRARLFEKDCFINKNPDEFIRWFQKFKETIDKWDILFEDTYNIDEEGAGLESTQKSYIIGPAEEKDARLSIEKNREWATFIKTISAIGESLKPFFVNKGMYVFRDLIEIMLKLGATLACLHNRWSNDVIALEYFKHFHKHAKPIGVYRLLVLNGHGSHITFEFKALANEYKIILLYLPAHTTHRLQPLDIRIFGP
jgi:hypothetical protein